MANPDFRPEFSHSGEISFAETMAWLLRLAKDSGGEAAEPHKKNIAKLTGLTKDCLDFHQPIRELLRERGVFIAHAETVDDLAERIEQEIEDGQSEIPRSTLHDAVRISCEKHGMSEDAKDALRDMILRIAKELDRQDRATPATSGFRP